MAARNEQSVKRVATILLAGATNKHGLTLDEIAEKTSLHRTTVNRIVLKQPGFGKALEPAWPHSYYYSHALAQRAMQEKAKRNIANDPLRELLIETTLGRALIHEVRPYAVHGNEHNLVGNLSNLTGILNNALEINPVTAGARFATDLELQKTWFKNFVALLNACRATYEFGLELISSEEFQEPDFWKVFIQPN